MRCIATSRSELQGEASHLVALELVGDDLTGGVQPLAQAGDASGVAAVCERRPERGAGERGAGERGPVNEGPVNAASVSPSSLLIASRCSGCSVRSLPISRSSAWRRCHSHRYSSASGKRVPTVLVRPWSLPAMLRWAVEAREAHVRSSVPRPRTRCLRLAPALALTRHRARTWTACRTTHAYPGSFWARERS
jgi:hypothetical protein